jgi:hypothetical protein
MTIGSSRTTNLIKEEPEFKVNWAAFLLTLGLVAQFVGLWTASTLALACMVTGSVMLLASLTIYLNGETGAKR